MGTERERLWQQRYELNDLVSHLSHSQLWRAYDNRLRRTVGLRIVDRRAPRFDALYAGAVAAAQITDRRFINVLDVMGPDPDDEVVIITEWIPGIALPEVLQEPMSPHGAATVMSQVAAAIASAHAQGVTHGHLRPANVLVLPDGAVRLRGHGVDAGLYGLPQDLDAVTADVHGLAALLYACLTARWPFPVRTGLPVAEQVDGRPVPVSACVADVPFELSAIVDRCWQGRYQSAAAVAEDLQHAAHESWSAPQPRRLTSRRQKAVAAGVVAGMVGGGVIMSLADAANRSGDPVTAQPRAQGSAALVTTVSPDARRLPVVGVRDYDPYGVDGENPEQRRYAVDRDPLTAWTTLTYYDPFMGGKPGVGLTVDLGAPRPVSSVDLKLVGANSNLQVLASNRRSDDPGQYRVFAEVTGAGSHILLRSPRPLTARYIVVWFTRLPWVDGSYRGGVRSIVVRSG